MSVHTVLLNGVAYSMLLFLIAAGLTLIFGLMGVVNFAHGALYALGAYLTVSIVEATGSFALAFVLAPLLVAGLGILIEYFTVRPLYDVNPIYMILLTFGLAIILEEAIPMIWGTQAMSMSPPEIIAGPVQLGPITYSSYRLFLIGLGVLVAGGLWLFIQRTRLGIIIRAGTVDDAMVNAMGINVRRVFTGMFAFGAGLAAFGGVAAVPVYSAYPAMGTEIILIAFIVVVIGGLGSLRGSFVGSLIIGVTYTFGSYYASQLVGMILFGLLIFVILLRPEGLYGQPGMFEH
jgi:branched-subunit amino acid ABC-type transport system permease component